MHSEDEHNHAHGDGVTMEPYVGYGLAAMAGKTITTCADPENFSEGGWWWSGGYLSLLGGGGFQGILLVIL